MGVGQRGLAGSGIVLDPNQARDDLKPWSQMAGGMLDDALSQSETVSKITHQKEEVIKIRCQKCGALNDEDAKYCDECGTKI
jgi:ribosomal protein L40E